MLLQQISVFVENRPGHMAEVCDVLQEQGVDITALSLADTDKFGILRLVVDQPTLAQETLKAAGFVVKVTDVLGVAMDDQPGGLASILHTVAGAGLPVEYLYAFVGKTRGKAVVVLRVNDMDKARLALEAKGHTLLTAQDMEAL